MPRAVAGDMSTPIGTRVKYTNQREFGYYPEYFGREGTIVATDGTSLYWVIFDGQLMLDPLYPDGRVCMYSNEIAYAACDGVLAARAAKLEEERSVNA